MKTSVIIPVLNEVDHLSLAVQRAWGAGASEVIVVDGGSTDGSWELAGQLDCRAIRSRRGRAAQQNSGAAIASGQVLLFQHADNWLAPDAVRQIPDRPTLVAGAFRQRIDADGLKYRLLEWGNAWRARWLGLPYGDQGLFVRRDVFERVGGFPDVPIMEDLLLMRRLRRLAWPLLLPGPLHVSPRRWQRYGVLRQTLRNWYLIGSWRLGVPLARLAGQYPRHDEPPGK